MVRPLFASRTCRKIELGGGDEYTTARMPRQCVAGGCRKVPSFGMPGTVSKTHCAEHKKADMVNLSSPRCDTFGCTIGAYYGPRGGRRQHCATHKTEDEINLAGGWCRHPGCVMGANFGIPGSGGKRFCAQHRTADMVCRRSCGAPGCRVAPSFHMPGETRRWFCVTHKEPGAVHSGGRLCETPGCTLRASYGARVGASPTSCATHRTAEMVAVRKRKSRRAPATAAAPARQKKRSNTASA